MVPRGGHLPRGWRWGGRVVESETSEGRWLAWGGLALWDWECVRGAGRLRWGGSMIFISYRQSDSNAFAELLERELVAVFGRSEVWRDKKRLKGSPDWEKDLQHSLERSDVVLAVIGSTWDNVCFEKPHRWAHQPRLRDPDDWVRKELTAALRRHTEKRTRVIPILVNQAELQSKEWLEEFDLQYLHVPQLHRMREDDFDSDFRDLCSLLSGISDLYGQCVNTWRGAKTGGNGHLPTSPAAAKERSWLYHRRLVSETQDLVMAGTGLKRKVKLPIAEAYFPLRMYLTPAKGHGSEKMPALERGDRERMLKLETLFEAAQKYRAVVILGEPGAGKTTAMRYFAWTVAETRSAQSLGLPEGIRPVLLKLRDVKPEDLECSDNTERDARARGALEGLWQAELHPQRTAGQSASPEDLLGPGPILWIFDGLDEVFIPEQRAAVRRAIDTLVRTAAGTPRQEDRFLVTSRIHGYYDRGVRFGEAFYEIEIDRLQFDESCDYIRRWFPEAEKEYLRGEADPSSIQKAVERGEKLIAELRQRKDELDERQRQTSHRLSRGLLELIENPLLLNIVCAVYDERDQLPSNRQRLYQTALELMLSRKPNERVRYQEDTAISVLADVAWWLNGQGDGVVGPESQLAKIATQALANRNDPGLDRDGSRFLEYMRQEVGLLYRGGGNQAGLGFLHRTLQEYLAAVAAIENGRAAELAERANEDSWKEVVALALRWPADFQRAFYRSFLRTDGPAKDPSRAAYYLEETGKIPVDEFDKVLQETQPSGKTSPEQAIAVIRLAQSRGLATAETLPALCVLARGADFQLRRVAASALGQQVAESAREAVAPPRAEVVAPIPHWGGTDLRTGTRRMDEATQLSLVWIEPGTFRMGSKPGVGDSDEHPDHEVTLTHGFWLGEFPVTNQQYRLFLKASPKSRRPPELWDDRRFNQDLQPVVGVSWLDAMAYCAWVTEQLGQPCTLPTEAQWEYACRAGSSELWCFGDDEKLLNEYAWFDQNSQESPQPVGTRQPNVWGLFDMHGNVWEWCYDLWELTVYQTRKQGVVDPVNSDPAKDHDPDALRVLRGGSWNDSAAYCRSAIRYRLRAVNRFRFDGFRVAVVPGPSRAQPEKIRP